MADDLFRTYLRIATLAFFGLLLGIGPVFSLTLDDAKRQGWLGERPDGYLGVVISTAPPEAKKLMKDINSKRQAVYRKIASKNGTDLSAVEALAGKKAIAQTRSGHYILLPSGRWSEKP